MLKTIYKKETYILSIYNLRNLISQFSFRGTNVLNITLVLQKCDLLHFISRETIFVREATTYHLSGRTSFVTFA